MARLLFLISLLVVANSAVGQDQQSFLGFNVFGLLNSTVQHREYNSKPICAELVYQREIKAQGLYEISVGYDYLRGNFDQFARDYHFNGFFSKGLIALTNTDKSAVLGIGGHLGFQNQSYHLIFEGERFGDYRRNFSSSGLSYGIFFRSGLRFKVSNGLMLASSLNLNISAISELEEDEKVFRIAGTGPVNDKNFGRDHVSVKLQFNLFFSFKKKEN